MMFLAYSMLCMTHFVLDNKIIFKIGYAFIINFGFLVTGNLIYIFHIQYTRYARNNVLSKLQKAFVVYYEDQFRKLTEMEERQPFVREYIRKRASNIV